jgi:hypothetical protein
MKKTPILHDLKNERPDLTPPLPSVMALLPFLFYAAVAGSTGLGALSVIKTKQAMAAEEDANFREQQEQSRTGLIQTGLAAITEEQNRAKEVETWIQSTRPMMSMITAVINSVKTGNTLTSLRLSRTPENPQHVEMTLLINNGGSTQVEETRNALSREGYQAFKEDTKTADRTNRLGDVTYSAVFVNTGTNTATAP